MSDTIYTAYLPQDNFYFFTPTYIFYIYLIYLFATLVKFESTDKIFIDGIVQKLWSAQLIASILLFKQHGGHILEKQNSLSFP